MSKQLELHALQQRKKACRLSRADIQEHKKKGNMIGYFGLVKLGRPLLADKVTSEDDNTTL